MSTRKSSLETRGSVKKYLAQGLTGSEIARLLGSTRQRINYWIQIIREEEGKNENPRRSETVS